MIPLMAREESNSSSIQCYDTIGIRRIAERSLQFDFLDVREATHLIQTAAANDSNSDLIRHTGLTPTRLRVLKKDE